MMPSLLILHRTDARDSGRLSTGNARAHVGSSDWPAIAPQILSSNLRSARSRLHPRSRFKPKRSNRQPRLSFPYTPTDLKSP
jgi:hypothetical protein